MFINFSNHSQFQEHHGKAIDLTTHEDLSPFPSLFLVHEQRVRGFRPFENVFPEFLEGVPWQDWIESDNVVDDVSGDFKRERAGGPTGVAAAGPPSAAAAGGGSSSGGSSVGLMPAPNLDVIVEIHSVMRGTIRVILYFLISTSRFFGACLARR